MNAGGMFGTEILLTTAELALALGGFGGVVAALIGDRERWDAMAVVRFRALIIISLGSALIALLPIPLSSGGLEGAALWGTASVIADGFASCSLIGMLIYARAPMTSHGSRTWSLAAVVITSAAIACYTLNALCVGFTRSFTGYYSALLLQLFLAGLYFFRLIVLSGPKATHARAAGMEVAD